MSADSLVLTLDIGTSSVRSLLWDETGREIETVHAQIPYEMHTTQDGGVEYPAADFLSLVVACLDRALEQAGNRADAIRAVGVTTFWHSLLGLDRQGKPITPLYSWADNRAAATARRLRRELDVAAIHARTGCMIHSSYYPAKLVWLRESEPEIFRQVAQWVSPAEYLYGELFGPESRRLSLSMASGTGLLNQSLCAWDTETFAALGLSPALFSPLTDLVSCPSGLRNDYARRWPALRSAPFLPAVGDGACSNVGSGCLTPERFAINLGTSGAIRALYQQEEGKGKREEGKEEGLQVFGSSGIQENSALSAQRSERKPLPSSLDGLWRYRVDANRPMIGAAFSDGGHVFAWMRKTLQLPEEAELERQLQAMKPGEHGLNFLPFLAGERSMGWNLDARAAIVGMNLDTSPVEIVRAGMEAVALQFAKAANRLREVFPEQKEIIASGGAFGHLPFWTQIFADTLGQPVTLTAEPEATSRGAALLAMESVGLLGNVEDAPARMDKTFLPDPMRHVSYQEMLEKQERMYEKLILSSFE